MRSSSPRAFIFGVPPHMVGDLSHSTYSNNEQQNIEFYNVTLSPWITKVEEEMNDKLFLESEKGRLYVDIDPRGLLRADTASRTNYYRQMYNIGAMSPNEIRAAEDLDAYEGGDDFFRPLNMESVKSQGNGQK